MEKSKKQRNNVYVSLPMRRKTIDEVLDRYIDIIEILYNKIPSEDFRIINGYDEEYSKSKFVSKVMLYVHLVTSIEMMKRADYICFVPTWQQEEACRIEHSYAEEQGFKILDIWGD